MQPHAHQTTRKVRRFARLAAQKPRNDGLISRGGGFLPAQKAREASPGREHSRHHLGTSRLPVAQAKMGAFGTMLPTTDQLGLAWGQFSLFAFRFIGYLDDHGAVVFLSKIFALLGGRK